MTVEEVRGSLDLTDSGAIKNSIRNCLTVFQNDPYLQGAVRYNILTERIGVHFSKESKDTLEDKMKRLMRDDVKTDNF